MRNKGFPRIKIGQHGELKDFTEIVKKSESAGGLMILIDEDGLRAFTYCRPSGKVIAKPILTRIERLLNRFFNLDHIDETETFDSL